MTSTLKAIERAIEGGWMNGSVRQAMVMFGKDGFRVFVNGFGWVMLHDKNEEPNGGLFQNKADSFRYEQAVIDPAFWQALGRAEGWEKGNPQIAIRACIKGTRYQMKQRSPIPFWQFKMHSLIDHLADGGTIEQFFTTLLTSEV